MTILFIYSATYHIMRCIEPNSGGAESEAEVTEVISVIAGDVFFGSSDRGADYQDAAFVSAMKTVVEIRNSRRQELGNAIFMFDQAGPWRDFIQASSLSQSKKRITLSRLKEQFKDPLAKFVIHSGLPLTFLDELEALPEEKLKFLFLNLAKQRQLDVRMLLENGLLGPKAFGPLPRGQLVGQTRLFDMIDDGAEDEDSDSVEDNVEFSADSCSLIRSPAGDLTQVSVSFEDYLARCRAVATALTLRAATLSSMDQADRVEAFYQYDNTAPNRVDPNVVTFGAEFAQKTLGLTAPVVTHFFVPHEGGVHESIFDTRGGLTIKRPN